MDTVFAAADAGRFHDVAIREALLDIARGLHGVDPETGRPLGDDEGARYPLALLARRHLGLDISADKHAPDAWRLRYGELDGVPLEQWPEGAVKYPLRDARLTLDVHLSQERAASGIPNGGNLHAEGDQVRAAIALHFASIWGIRTGAGRVEELRLRVEQEWKANRAHIQASGIFRANGTKDSKRLARLITAAFNGAPPDTSPSERFPDGPVAADRDTLLGWGDGLLEDPRKSGRVDEYKSIYLDVVEASTALPVNQRFNVLVCRFSKKPGGTPHITSPFVFPENFSSVEDRQARSRAATPRKSEPGGMPEPSPESAPSIRGWAPSAVTGNGVEMVA
ncbi:hypothetical protein [Myxococcus sp. AB025B]|uniref:hypothetical protein n=1 Tax=Myxococcus sp. AB025B TaxID=2562794 RepID=UPI001E35FCF8|nr:hypothetical protein [Myxococcus sp. AB025B]